MTRERRVSELTNVYCDSPSIIMAAMQTNGTWSIRIKTGRTVPFVLEGDYLVARVTPVDAAALAELDLFEVEGGSRKVRPAATVRNWMEEGERLYQEKMGRAPAKSDNGGIAELLRALLGGEDSNALIAQRAAELVAQKAEEEAQRRADERLAELARQKAEMSAEFGFVRLSEYLADEDVLQLFNEFLPGVDPATIPSAARITRLSKACATDLTLQAAVRALLPEYDGE